MMRAREVSPEKNFFGCHHRLVSWAWAHTGARGETDAAFAVCAGEGGIDGRAVWAWAGKAAPSHSTSNKLDHTTDGMGRHGREQGCRSMVLISCALLYDPPSPSREGRG